MADAAKLSRTVSLINSSWCSVVCFLVQKLVGEGGIGVLVVAASMLFDRDRRCDHLIRPSRSSPAGFAYLCAHGPQFPRRVGAHVPACRAPSKARRRGVQGEKKHDESLTRTCFSVLSHRFSSPIFLAGFLRHRRPSRHLVERGCYTVCFPRTAFLYI